MGRRSRRRDDVPLPAPPVRATAARRGDDRPKAPWHPFPLVELCVLAGLILCVMGFLNFDSENGRMMLLAGMVLGSLAGLDTAVREHFAGFRSHSTLLAGLPAVALAGTLYFLGAVWVLLAPAAVALFVAAFLLLRRAFRRRSGGLSFKVR